MSLFTLALASALTLTQASQPGALDPGVVTGHVTLIDEAELAAPEPGILIELRTPVLDTQGQPVLRDGQPVYEKVRKGLRVREGQVLARIDDRKAKAAQTVAAERLAVARLELASDINVLYSKAQLDVADFDLEMALTVNARVPGAITAQEINQKKLQKVQAELQVKQAEHEHGIAERSLAVREAELEAAKLDVELREIRAPFDGVVIDIPKHIGESVQTGEPVMTLYRMDRVRFGGKLNFHRISHDQVDGKPVTLTVMLTNGVTAEFPGTVVFTRPFMEQGGLYYVEAEVENKMVNGHWQLLKELQGTMTIRWQ